MQTGKSCWEAGLSLFNENAVLDIQPQAAGLNCRVANEIGRFAEAVIRFRGSSIASSCSCRKPTPVCEHAVAGILATALKMPEILPASLLKQPPARAEQAQPPAEPAAAAATGTAETRNSGARSKVPEIAIVSLEIPVLPPGLYNKDCLFNIKPTIFWRGKSYAANNLRAMIDGGKAGGDMGLTDFPAREQQIIRFLCSHGEKSGAGFDLDSTGFCSLLHLLQGSCQLDGSDGLPLFVMPDELEIVRAGGRKIKAFLQLPEHGFIPAASVGIFTGTQDSWIYWEREFRLLRGITDRQLLEACRGARQSADTVKRVWVVARRSRCKPVLDIDWRGTKVFADFHFDYGQQKTTASQVSALIWQKNRFIRRDFKAEAEARQQILNLGFVIFQKNSGNAAPRLQMTDSATIWRLINTDFNNTIPGWQVNLSTEFAAQKKKCRNLRLSFASAQAGTDWFSLKCQSANPLEQNFPWRSLWTAVNRGEAFFKMPDGSIRHITKRLQTVLANLSKRSLECSENFLRFRNSTALLVNELTRPMYNGAPAQWQMIAERLAAGDGVKPLPEPPGFQGELRDYQKSGLAWIMMLAEYGFNGILADEMGLGKTVQALAALAVTRNSESANMLSMIVCPTSLVENWLRETSRFTPELRCMAVRGQQRAELLKNAGEYDLLITSYALLRRDISKYNEFKFTYLILDEAQHIKNPRTANARTCKALNSKHRLILTGTPLENCLRDIWSLFDFLQPGHLGAQREFLAEYDSWQSAEGRNAMLRAVSTQVRPFMLRRTKKDVCSQLPPKTEQTLYCELSVPQRELYDNLLFICHEEFARACSEDWQSRRFHVLTALLRLRQVCCHPTLLPQQQHMNLNDMPSAKTELLQELLLESIDSNHRVLVFSQFTSMLKLIRNWLDEREILYEYLDGGSTERQEKVDRFNRSPDIPVFLLSLKAGGTGLNLTGADTVIHYDLWWNPMVEQQATDRTHRIGQERPVTAIRLLVRDTVEEQIIKLQDKKRDMFNRLMEGVPLNPSELTAADIAEIIDYQQG